MGFVFLYVMWLCFLGPPLLFAFGFAVPGSSLLVLAPRPFALLPSFFGVASRPFPLRLSRFGWFFPVPPSVAPSLVAVPRQASLFRPSRGSSSPSFPSCCSLFSVSSLLCMLGCVLCVSPPPLSYLFCLFPPPIFLTAFCASTVHASPPGGPFFWGPPPFCRGPSYYHSAPFHFPAYDVLRCSLGASCLFPLPVVLACPSSPVCWPALCLFPCSWWLAPLPAAFGGLHRGAFFGPPPAAVPLHSVFLLFSFSLTRPTLVLWLSSTFPASSLLLCTVSLPVGVIACPFLLSGLRVSVSSPLLLLCCFASVLIVPARPPSRFSTSSFYASFPSFS